MYNVYYLSTRTDILGPVDIRCTDIYQWFSFTRTIIQPGEIWGEYLTVTILFKVYRLIA